MLRNIIFLIRTLETHGNNVEIHYKIFIHAVFLIIMSAPTSKLLYTGTIGGTDQCLAAWIGMLCKRSLLNLTESSEMSNVLEVSAQQISYIDLSAGLAYSSHKRKMADYHTIGIVSSKLLRKFAWTFNIDLFIL